MNVLRSLIPALCATTVLAACSGNMGTGATPPVSAPAAAPLAAQAVAAAPLTGRVSTPPPLSAQTSLAVPATALVTLPTAGGFGGTVCIGPSTADSFSCVQGSASSTATPAAKPSAAPTATPKSVLITPPPKKYVPLGVHLVLSSYPTSAPVRDDSADDGATSPLMTLDIVPSTNLTINGLNAFTLTLPQDQASSEHHYAFVLFDHDTKTAHSSGLGILPHRKVALHGASVAVSAQLTGTTLQFVDDTTRIPLLAKHRYVAVLYSDTVTPTAAPTSAAIATAAATVTPAVSGSPGATGTPGVLPTPYVTYPNLSNPSSNSVPLNAATPFGTSLH